jgi:HSP20 family protein
MTEKTIPVKSEKDVATTREEERYLRPPVDIYETDDGLTVLCDMPGVNNENIDVNIDDNILTIQGRTEVESKGEPIYSEFNLANFFRQFELSEYVDQEKIAAELKNGVLTLHLPKAEKAKPKKVQIKVG